MYLLYIYVNSAVTDTFTFDLCSVECTPLDFFLRLFRNYV